jgi:hypothetical protein
MFQSSLSAFRVEGKKAIRTQLDPKRLVLVRQPSMLAYQ